MQLSARGWSRGSRRWKRPASVVYALEDVIVRRFGGVWSLEELDGGFEQACAETARAGHEVRGRRCSPRGRPSTRRDKAGRLAVPARAASQGSWGRRWLRWPAFRLPAGHFRKPWRVSTGSPASPTRCGRVPDGQSGPGISFGWRVSETSTRGSSSRSQPTNRHSPRSRTGDRSRTGPTSMQRGEIGRGRIADPDRSRVGLRARAEA